MRLKLFIVFLVIFILITTIIYSLVSKYHPPNVNVEIELHLLKSSLQSQLRAILESYYVVNDVHQLTRNLQSLAENFDLPLDWTTPDQCSHSQVCDEVYHGNLADLPWHTNAWSLQANCSNYSLTIINYHCRG